MAQSAWKSNGQRKIATGGQSEVGVNSYGASSATDHEQIVQDIRVVTLGMRRDDAVDLRAGKVWVLNVDMDGQPCDANISQKNSALWVNVGALESGSKVDAVYQIAGGGNALNFTLALVHPGTFLGQEKFTFKQLSELFLVLPWLPVTIHAMV